MRKDVIRVFGIAVAAVVLVGAASAQERQKRMAFIGEPSAGMTSMNVAAFAPQGGTFNFIGAHAGMEGKVVKGSPYSAEGVTETEKTLADGTRITKKTTSKIYRDSEGRTRREMTLGAVGPWSAEGEAITTITINDPVSGRMYVMRKGGSDVKTINVIGPDVRFGEIGERGRVFKREVEIAVEKSGEGELREAHDIELVAGPEANVWVQKEPTGAGGHVVQTHDLTRASNSMAFISDKDAKTEDLGERNIEGVVATGTRVTHTIPEGKIGNDRPISITSERWYSEELGATVMTKTKDPMSGNVSYKLTNISRAEPDPSLFEIDEDIEVHEGHSIERRMKIEKHKAVPDGN